MTDKQSSPFSGLDKALLRSTLPEASKQEEPAAELDAQEATSHPKHTRQRSITRSSERMNERSFVRTNDAPNERAKVRHSFDIYQDQLLRLSEIQSHIYRESGKKPKIGELVQQALDTYLDNYEHED